MKITQSNLSNKDRAWLKMAKKLAVTGECKKRHGAVAVRGGRVISVGINRYRQDQDYSFIPQEARSFHAEEACLRALGGDAQGATLYVARVSRKFKTEMMSKPCDECMNLIVAAGVKRIVYTIESEISL